MYPEICNPSKHYQADRLHRRSTGDVFICKQCQAVVYTQAVISGVQNRNHCPYCLWSKHVDHTQPGDRMSACKAVMQPIGVTIKHSRNKYGNHWDGELMLIHRCCDCGKLSINRIAADDLIESLMDIFQSSFELDLHTQQNLKASGIRLLQEADHKLVVNQLCGRTEEYQEAIPKKTTMQLGYSKDEVMCFIGEDCFVRSAAGA